MVPSSPSAPSIILGTEAKEAKEAEASPVEQARHNSDSFRRGNGRSVVPHRRLLLDRSHRHQDQGEKKGTSEKRGKRGDGDGDGKDGEENNY